MSATAGAQIALQPAGQTKLTLHPGETKSLLSTGEPHSLAVVEIHLLGGLIGLQSPEAARRILDLGQQGRLLYAVEIPADGIASLNFTSGEHLREASVSVEQSTQSLTDSQRLHLHTAGIAFATADSARRHQPHAPDAATALKDYEQAASEALAAGDPSLARWALTQEARFLLYQKSHYVETKELLERAAQLPVADDPATEAQLYKTLSSCEYFLGDLPGSVAHGERALALYRQTGDRYWQGIVLGNLISGYGEMGRDQEAAASAREALADAEQTQDTAGVVFSLTELANVYRRQGSLQLAFQSFREAQTWAEDIRYAPLVQAEIEQAVGEFDMELGLWSEAQEQLADSLRHASANSELALQARGLLARADDRRGDLQAALREYDAAITTARQLKLVHQEAALLIGRSATLLRAHQASAALQTARDAVSLAKDQNSPSLQVEAELAEGAACLQACPTAAPPVDIYRAVLRQIDESGEREKEAAAYAGLALAQAQLGDDLAAFDESERALSSLEGSRASFDSHDLAASYFIAHRGWYALAIDLAVKLERLHPGQGYGDKAFQLAERAKARAMLDALGDQQWNDVQPASEAGQASTSNPLLRRIAANQYKITAQKAQLLSDDNPAKAATALKALYHEQDALEGERRSVTSSRRDLTSTASIAAVQADLLDGHSALLAYASGEHATYRWLITRSSSHMDVLSSPDELARRVVAVRQTLGRRSQPLASGEDAAAYSARLVSFEAHRAAELQQAGSLLLPAMPATIKHLYIAADGVLQTAPWGALRTSCVPRRCYAIERYAISAEPSASVAVALAQRPGSAHGTRAVIVSDALPASAQAVPRWRQLEQLPGSRREAEAIAHLVPAADIEDLHRGEANEANLQLALRPDVGTLHLAAHTLLVAGHPELSGIALSASKHQDGVLWLRDIPRLNAPPLVVLSGCTTQGADPSSEELNTLTQAFFYAGAQQVVASGWDVDDDATVRLMELFYRNLFVRHLPAAEALRAAQVQRLAQGADVTDWAAFLIEGVPARSAALESARR